MKLCMLNKPISESICLVLTSYECPNSFNQTASTGSFARHIHGTKVLHFFK